VTSEADVVSSSQGRGWPSLTDWLTLTAAAALVCPAALALCTGGQGMWPGGPAACTTPTPGGPLSRPAPHLHLGGPYRCLAIWEASKVLCWGLQCGCASARGDTGRG